MSINHISVQSVGVLLGSAAAALVLGAGVAQADDSASGADSQSGVSRAASADSTDRAPASSGHVDRSGVDRNGSETSDDEPRKTLGDNRFLSARVADEPPARLTRLRAESEEPGVTALSRPAAPSRRDVPLTPVALLAPVSRPGSDGADDPAIRPLIQAVDDPGQAAAQFTRQMVGLTFDAGAVGASLVNNIATLVAQGFGPSPIAAIPRSVALSVASAAGDVSKVFTATPFNAASAGPFPVNYGVFNLLAYLTPAAIPPGANDPSISVTAAHPLPVILVNGTGMTAAFNWSVGAPVLANAGYKVYTFNYGNRSGYPNFPVQGVNDITVSAQQLSQEIDRVLAETGAPQVILVGYSQGGGILPAYYINVLGGGPKVSQVIGLAPSNHGTDLDYLAYATLLPVIGPLLTFVVNTVAPGALQQIITSPFQDVVYGDGDTRPGVLYTNIVSMNDEVVTPYTQQFLSGPNVRNIVVQSRQPGFYGGHGSILVNPTVWTLVLEALAANPAANPLLAPIGSTVAA